jgi:hypothetical protein
MKFAHRNTSAKTYSFCNEIYPNKHFFFFKDLSSHRILHPILNTPLVNAVHTLNGNLVAVPTSKELYGCHVLKFILGNRKYQDEISNNLSFIHFMIG